MVNAYIAVHQDWEGRVVLAQQNGVKPEAAWPSAFPEYAPALALAREDFQSHSGYVSRDKYRPEKPRAIEDELLQARKVYFLEAGEPVAAWEIVLAGADTVAEVTYWVGGAPQRILGHRSAVLDFDGSGRVFLPNPVNSLNDTSLRDSSPDSAFTAAYSTVTLPGLNGPSPYTLTGPWVTITSMTSEPPLISPPRKPLGYFNYTRNQDGFEAVNVYFWITARSSTCRAWDSTPSSIAPSTSTCTACRGLTIRTMSAAPSAPATSLTATGAWMTPRTPTSSCTSTAMPSRTPPTRARYFGSGETGAMGEGFGDYWAFSQTYQLSVDHGFDPFCIGEWDSTSYSPRLPAPRGHGKDLPDDYSLRRTFTTAAGSGPAR